MFRVCMLALFMATVMVLGCGSRNAPPAVVYPVTGRVTYQGEPLVGADLTFYSEDEGRSAFGRTNDRGEYQLTTFSSNDGAVAGKQIVTIAKIETPPAPRDQPDVDSAEYVPPEIGESLSPPPVKSTFPEKFGKQETSGLVAVVNADAANRIDFDLTD